MSADVMAGPQLSGPGVYDIPESEYFGPDLALTTLSSSGAKKLLPPSCPQKFDHWRRAPQRPRAVFDMGKVVHALVLGDPTQKIAKINADDWRTAKARAERDEARALGQIPILSEQYDEAVAIAAQVATNRYAARLFDPETGKPEQTLIWQDQTSGVQLRARLDWLPTVVPGRRLIIPDLKTAESAYGEDFGRSAANYGYFIQEAFYLEGLRALGLHDEPALIFVVVEKEPPYAVNVIQLDDTALTIGRNLMRAAINTYAECTAADKWPGYHDGVQRVSLPDWFVRRYDEEN